MDWIKCKDKLPEKRRDDKGNIIYYQVSVRSGRTIPATFSHVMREKYAFRAVSNGKILKAIAWKPMEVCNEEN